MAFNAGVYILCLSDQSAIDLPISGWCLPRTVASSRG